MLKGDFLFSHDFFKGPKVRKLVFIITGHYSKDCSSELTLIISKVYEHTTLPLIFILCTQSGLQKDPK